MQKLLVGPAAILIMAITSVLGPQSAMAQSSPRRTVGTARGYSEQSAPLVAVHAIGSQRYGEEDIAAAAGLKKGTQVRPQDFKTAADELVASGVFEEVRYRYEPAGAGYVVTFEVADSEQFLPVSYDNFVWFTDQQLTDAVHRRFPLFRGEVSTNQGMLEKVTDVLQGLLAERGIAGTVRFIQEGTYGRGKVDGKIRAGIFTIEGLNVAVRQMQFPGAPDSDLPELQKTAEPLLQAPYQRSIVAAFAENNLRPLYAKHGYLKASFSAPELKMLKDDVKAPEVELLIAVQPGAQYRVAKYRWWGNKAFHAEDLQKLLSVKPGGVADRPQLESDLGQVQKLYYSQGYLRESVAINPTYDDSDDTVSYEFAVQEGDVYRLHEVEIAGAGLTKDTVARLREAWQMREGEPYDAGYERQYMKAIRRLVAPNVSVEMNRDISDQNKTVDVNINFVVHADKTIPEDTSK